jgi:hypothetical protein
MRQSDTSFERMSIFGQDNLRLVRRYEPTLGFSKDGKGEVEAFFPMAVDDYVGKCALWHQGSELLPPGQVTLQKLAELGAGAEDYFLVYATREALARIPQPARARAMAQGITLSRLAGMAEQPVLSVRAPRGMVGQLQAAGLAGLPALGREVDLAWEAESTDVNQLYQEDDEQPGGIEPFLATGAEEGMIDLVLLGEEVDLSSAEAEMAPYALGLADRELEAQGLDVIAAGEVRKSLRDILSRVTQLGPEIREQARKNYYGDRALGSPPVPPTYYYRVIPDHKGYIVLQYWFFYAYNDWGTAHDGINDHEGDWEGIMVFLQDEDTPKYVAYSRHIRLPKVPRRPFLLAPDTRPWGHQDLRKLYGLHPVVRVGCGSHASYVERKSHAMGWRGVLWVEDHAWDNQLRIGPGQLITWKRRIDLEQEAWTWFGGHWGILERGLRGLGTDSPQGPRTKARWEKPVTWAWIPPY